MRNPSEEQASRIREAAAYFGRRRYVLTCYYLDEQVFTYDVLADNREQAVQSCHEDNPMAPVPYIIGKITLHIPIL